MQAFDAFALTPLSAGDIIDRAIRLYRRHFLVLLRIVVGPSLVAYSGGIIYTLGTRNFSLERGDARMILTTLMVIGGIMLYIGGKIAFFAMLGGTARGLVAYFASGEQLTARGVFRTVRARWRQLIGATVLVFMLLATVLSSIYFLFAFVFISYLLLVAALTPIAPAWLLVTMHVIFGLLVVIGLLVIFLLVYSRIVFVPQALMVEEKGVFGAVGRSISLVGRDLRKIAAILLFQLYIAWSLLLLLVIPLGWYGYLQGVDVNPFSGSAPLWYNITEQTLAQMSEILLAPIAMLSFTLLYLDVRVRREGFDVELLANRRLPPAVWVAVPPPAEVVDSAAAPAEVASEVASVEPDETEIEAGPAEPELVGVNPVNPVNIDEGAPASQGQ